jgi:hypothetical protein
MAKPTVATIQRRVWCRDGAAAVGSSCAVCVSGSVISALRRGQAVQARLDAIGLRGNGVGWRAAGVCASLA